jgi:SAM-dependent methyltransferase
MGPPGAAARFDAQAASFDSTRGVAAGVASAVAAAVVDVAGPAGALVVLEVGAGTGEIGLPLAALVDGYVGLDLSRPMLEVFGRRVGDGRPGGRALVQADADRGWPVRSRSTDVVFASRSAHLLGAAHVVAESRRVCRPGGCFVVGRVERAGVRSDLRRRREALLRDRGLAPRSGVGRTRALLEGFVAGGARPIEKRAVATWTAETTAADVLAAWEATPTMGGVAVPAEVRAEVLADLRRWATEKLGDLDRVDTFTEQYTLEGVRIA